MQSKAEQGFAVLGVVNSPTASLICQSAQQLEHTWWL